MQIPTTSTSIRRKVKALGASLKSESSAPDKTWEVCFDEEAETREGLPSMWQGVSTDGNWLCRLRSPACGEIANKLREGI